MRFHLPFSCSDHSASNLCVFFGEIESVRVHARARVRRASTRSRRQGFGCTTHSWAAERHGYVRIHVLHAMLVCCRHRLGDGATLLLQELVRPALFSCVGVYVSLRARCPASTGRGVDQFASASDKRVGLHLVA